MVVTEQVTVRSRAQWRSWLIDHHSTSRGIWLLTFKKGQDASGAARPHLPYDEVVEEALCFGWVDSTIRKYDDDRSQLLVTPRKRGSNWSRANKQRIARLLAAQLMDPAGLACVAAAQADGSWAALDEVDALVEPPDLGAALDADPEARRRWDSFPPSAKRGIVEWLLNARRPETRAGRVVEIATLAARGERANQWRPRPPPT